MTKGKGWLAKKQTANTASTRSQNPSSADRKTTKPKVEGLAKSEEPFAAHCEELSSDDSSVESIKLNPEESQQRGSFLAGRNDQFILLVYPFTGDEKEIEAAADGLNEASGATRADAHPQQSEVSGQARDDYKKLVGCLRQRIHYVTVRVKDFKRLEPLEWFNDSLVDFWMQW
jgi:hypothetical protein